MNNDYRHPYTGKYVLVRTYASGVHVGYLKEYDPQTRHGYLTETRIIFYWEGAFTLHTISVNGIKDGKLPLAIPEIMLSDILEIIVCSDNAAENLKNFPIHQI
jgi:hypothetical protein